MIVKTVKRERAEEGEERAHEHESNSDSNSDPNSKRTVSAIVIAIDITMAIAWQTQKYSKGFLMQSMWTRLTRFCIIFCTIKAASIVYMEYKFNPNAGSVSVKR